MAWVAVVVVHEGRGISFMLSKVSNHVLFTGIFELDFYLAHRTLLLRLRQRICHQSKPQRDQLSFDSHYLLNGARSMGRRNTCSKSTCRSLKS
jgi:hypothetical protein